MKYQNIFALTEGAIYYMTIETGISFYRWINQVLFSGKFILHISDVYLENK